MEENWSLASLGHFCVLYICARYEEKVSVRSLGCCSISWQVLEYAGGYPMPRLVWIDLTDIRSDITDSGVGVRELLAAACICE